MRSRPFAALGCLIGLLAGCAEAGDPSAAELTDVPWELVSGTVDGAEIPVVEGHPITLSFTGDEAGGTAACNGYGGAVAISRSEITFSELASTAMACIPDSVMESETAYLEALPLVKTFSVTEDELSLVGDGVELTFVALPPVPTSELTGTVWVLESLIQGDSVSSVEGERATVELFTDGSMLGSTGCRTLDGQYIVSGAEVVMTEMSAHGECPAELETQDSHVVTVLGDGFRATTQANTLTLTASGRQGLVYRGQN